MKVFDKLRTICLTYNIYLEQNIHFDMFLIQKVMLRAYEYHKDIPFEEYVRECVKSPIEYLYSLSQLALSDYLVLSAVNNCFNDKNKIHYGVKYKGKWFFISHSANSYSLKLRSVDFSIKNREDSSSYLVSYSGVMPNIVIGNIGKVSRKVVEDYINLFL